MIEPKLTLAQVVTLLGRPTNVLAEAAEEAAIDLLHSGWYTTEEVAALIGVDPSTLRRWRTCVPPQGPAFVQLSSRVTQYSVPDVEAWLRAQRVDPARVA
ncbi:helix-turn-helix transcriptional regulator [Streptacidiphilus anmyonensis]|uniref:helix-turn-helix transcriptional regulator n=1 Tax=Streptacidiphilus anmyonensis TaxID=405782 RepID=UPI001F29C7EB|nr:helix-turn-helix domain-containing protein [Streptacidiphilus anmyonensis]